MDWKAYRVALRLRSQLHIGWRKVGNLQQTRGYVPAKALWAAMTMRIARDSPGGNAGDPATYQRTGEELKSQLAFSYFFIATRENGDYRVHFPWAEEADFPERFVSGYSSTALRAGRESAAEGYLHEVECILPRAAESGETVFLVGNVFERRGAQATWRRALRSLQVGGERGYGWGDIELADLAEVQDYRLFGDDVEVQLDGHRPVVIVRQAGVLLAHAPVRGVEAEGSVEPLVGREWAAGRGRRTGAGQSIVFSGMCFAPGSKALRETVFTIDELGLWQPVI